DGARLAVRLRRGDEARARVVAPIAAESTRENVRENLIREVALDVLKIVHARVDSGRFWMHALRIDRELEGREVAAPSTGLNTSALRVRERELLERRQRASGEVAALRVRDPRRGRARVHRRIRGAWIGRKVKVAGLS